MSTPCRGAATFDETLDHVLPGVPLVVSIVCGNDYYAQKVKPVTHHMEQAIAHYCSRVSKLARVHLAVTGMPSDVWDYQSWMTSTSWQQYDSNSAAFRALFEKNGAVSITGAAELRGIHLADRIGHIHVDSEAVVTAAYISWVRRANAALPPPPPPPPPAPAVEFPWSAHWSPQRQRHYFVYGGVSGMGIARV